MQLCEAALHIYAGQIILEATEAPALVRTTENALMALQVLSAAACVILCCLCVCVGC